MAACWPIDRAADITTQFDNLWDGAMVPDLSQVAVKIGCIEKITAVFST